MERHRMADEVARPWTVLSSTVSFEDRWLKVRSDHCVTAAGAHVAPFHVLDYPDWVNVVPLTKDLRVVLIREYRHGRAAVLDGLVSGGVERHDGTTDAAERAARREMREETGYGGGRFVPVLESFPNAASHTNRVTSFLALDVALEGPSALEPGESIDTYLDDLPSVMTRLRDGSLPMQALHVAALWAAAGLILAGDPRVAGAEPLRAGLRRAILGE
ncbi:MAG TPA: NUDIX hydrolase [Rhizomicrobium sp.]|nr:NUDIX hydrolase [Rhizomicrobium sp.]